MHYTKCNLVYVAEDYKLPIDHFINFCIEYHPNKVWSVYEMVYCYPTSIEYLVSRYNFAMENV
jgi:hypothetical protein